MERKKKRLASPLRRKVHIDGDEWTYTPGNTTFILNPARDTKWSVRQIDFFPGATWDDIERAEDKGYSRQFAVMPSLVKEWIETKLLGKVFKESLRVRQIVSVAKRGGKIKLTSLMGLVDKFACTICPTEGSARVICVTQEEACQLKSLCDVVVEEEPVAFQDRGQEPILRLT